MESAIPILRTRLCDLLGIQYPIVQAGMGFGATTPELVAAVSNAGGLGILGAHMMKPDQLRAALRAIKDQTDRPFGVNFIIASPEPGSQDVATAQDHLDRLRKELGLPPGPRDLAIPPSAVPDLLPIVFDEQIPVLSFGLGDPSPYVAAAHERGMRVITMVATLDEARHAAGTGTDIIAAQGAEAGGHRSNFAIGNQGEPPAIGTLALVPRVVDAVAVPVLAAGGIMDGRGLAAALALGADGVLMGTRFLTARESGVFPAYQQALLRAEAEDTIISAAPTGRPARSVRNRLTEALAPEGFSPLPYPLQAMAAMDIYVAAAARGRADLFPLWAGQGVGLLKEGQGAGEIVAETAREAATCIARLAHLGEGRDRS